MYYDRDSFSTAIPLQIERWSRGLAVNENVNNGFRDWQRSEQPCRRMSWPADWPLHHCHQRRKRRKINIAQAAIIIDASVSSSCYCCRCWCLVCYSCYGLIACHVLQQSIAVIAQQLRCAFAGRLWRHEPDVAAGSSNSRSGSEASVVERDDILVFQYQ